MRHIASLLIAAMLVMGVRECAVASDIRSIPVVVPFAAQVKGTVLELDLRLQEERGYSFILNLGFTRGDDSSRRRIAQLAGTGARRADETPVDTGLAIPLDLTIRRLQSLDAPPMYKKQIADFPLQGYSDSYYSKTIDRVWLMPGEYRIRVEALQDIPELRGTPISLVIAYRTK